MAKAALDLSGFVVWLGDLSAPFRNIDGLIFMDRRNVGEVALRKLVAEQRSPQEAQKWINLIPFSDLLDEVVGNWSLNDPALKAFLEVYKTTWSHQMAAKHPMVGYIIEEIAEPEDGEIYLRLVNA